VAAIIIWSTTVAFSRRLTESLGIFRRLPVAGVRRACYGRRGVQLVDPGASFAHAAAPEGLVWRQTQ
jgi:hypothetical protein